MSRRHYVPMAMFFSSLFLCLALLELYGYIKYKKPVPSVCQNCYSYVDHPKLGKFHPPNSSHVATRTCGENLCYQVQYNYDQFGRRTIGLKNRNSQHIALFGCSYTFGEALADPDTLAYKISQRSQAHIYNFGRSAVGPAFALAQTRMEDFAEQIPEKEGYGIYILAKFQSNRNSLTSEWPWARNTPGYLFNSEGQIVFEGFQYESNPLLFRVISFYDLLRKHSYFLKYLSRDFPRTSLEELDQMTVNILKNLKETYEQKTSGKFIVVTHVLSPITEELGKKIRAANIPLFETPAPKAWSEKHRVCECDSHPTGYVNEYMADQIIDALEKLKSTGRQ